MGFTNEGYTGPQQDLERRDDTYAVGKPYFGLKARAGKKAEIKIRTDIYSNGLEVWEKYKLGNSAKHTPAS